MLLSAGARPSITYRLKYFHWFLVSRAVGQIPPGMVTSNSPI
jgi:hypothetical protein